MLNFNTKNRSALLYCTLYTVLAYQGVGWGLVGGHGTMVHGGGGVTGRFVMGGERLPLITSKDQLAWKQ